MIYTITNCYAGNLQIKFDKKPVQGVIDYLKEQKMRWNWTLGVWFGAGDERAITLKLNALTREDADSKQELAIGGVVGDGYLGGGEWTGANFEASNHYLSYGEINKAVKKAFTQRHPEVPVKVSGQSYSGGQSSTFHMFLTTDQIFAGFDTFKKHYRPFWYEYRDLDEKLISVRDTDATQEIREKAARYQYNILLKAYSHSVGNIEEYLTDYASDLYKHAKKLYNSFIHDESNSNVDYFDRNLYDRYEICNIDNADTASKWHMAPPKASKKK